MDFGKSRIQFEQELWSRFKFEKYDVYFYLAGKNLATYTAKSALAQLEQLETYMDYPLEERVQFIIYNRHSDYMQSNIGLQSADAQVNVGGTTRIVGNKVILFYEGDHEKLSKQLRMGLAEVYFNQMLYGGNLKEAIRNAALLNVPDWYCKGFASYFGQSWNVELDNKVKDGIKSGGFKDLSRMMGPEATLAGHSLWNYIAETYGKNVIPNIIYMTRVSRNIESGFMYVLGVSLKSLVSEWQLFYQAKYLRADLDRNFPPKEDALLFKKSKKTVLSQFKISPDGKFAIYTSNQYGKYKVYLRNLETKKSKRIYKRGQKINRLNDYSMPVMAWHPSGKYFTFVTEEKGKMWMHYYYLEEQNIETKPILNFEKILHYDYSPDGKKFVMSAVQNGFTDVFVYTPASNVADQITKDAYDDLYPTFVNKGKEIVFSSNRTNDTLIASDQINEMKHTLDLFLFDYAKHHKVLKRLTDTPLLNETQAAPYDSSHIIYLNDYNGIVNRFVGSFDSSLAFVDTSEHYQFKLSTYPITNSARNINYQNVSLKSKKLAEIITTNGRTQLRISNLISSDSLTPVNLKNTSFRELQNLVHNVVSIPIPEQAETNKSFEPKFKALPKAAQGDTSKPKPGNRKIDVFGSEPEQIKTKTGKIDINNYTFGSDEPLPISVETEKIIPKSNSPILETNDKKLIQEKPISINSEEPKTTENNIDTMPTKEVEFRLPRQLNYNKYYTIDYLTSQLDNGYMSTNYQQFQGGGPIFYNPAVNGLIKLGIKDLFEDYRIVGAFRIGTDLKSNEYLIGTEDLSKRLDKQFTLYRRNIFSTSNNNTDAIKNLTHEIKYSVKWPFTEFLAWKSTLSVRNDRTTYPVKDDITLIKDFEYNYWSTFRQELIFDNTQSVGTNLPIGMKWKIFGEYYRHLNIAKTNIGIVGFDARHYTKIFREFIWANRIAGSTSFGDKKLVYFMGGTDQWLFPKYNQNLEVRKQADYAFQTLATSMRGFNQNSRNGNSFSVISSELRVPIFRFFSNKPLRSDFINNFQLIGFSDLGTAWTGTSPFDPENTIFSTVVAPVNQSYIIILDNQINPIIGSYGWGIRSRILGYFLRADWAFGIQDGLKLPRVFYLSIGTDF